MPQASSVKSIFSNLVSVRFLPCLHLHRRRISGQDISMKAVENSSRSRGDMFPWNVGRLSTEYTVLHPRSLVTLYFPLFRSWIRKQHVPVEIFKAVAILRDVTPHRPVEVRRRFGETSSHSKNKESNQPARSLLRPWRRRQHVPPKRRWTSISLHGVSSPKILLFMNWTFCSI